MCCILCNLSFAFYCLPRVDHVRLLNLKDLQTVALLCADQLIKMIAEKVIAIITIDENKIIADIRAAELGSLSSGAKMAMKIFVKRVFTIFASNASFLRVIANLPN